MREKIGRFLKHLNNTHSKLLTYFLTIVVKRKDGIRPVSADKSVFQRGQKKKIKIRVKLEQPVTNDQAILMFPLFRISRKGSTADKCSNIKQRSRPLTVGQRYAAIELSIGSFDEECHAGTYKISYWDGTRNENQLVIKKKRILSISLNKRTRAGTELTCGTHEHQIQHNACNTGICCRHKKTGYDHCRCPDSIRGANCGASSPQRKVLRIFPRSGCIIL